jgi:hypothetical protein
MFVQLIGLGLQVFTAGNVKVVVLWVVRPFNVGSARVNTCTHFKERCD